MENNLPNGWVKIELHEVAAEIDYPIGDGDHGQIKPSMYKDKGIPYIRVSDMGWGNFKPDNLVYIDTETHSKNLKSELHPGDVLIAKTGATIGKCCIVPDFIEKANTTSSVGKVTLDQRLISPEYLLKYFLSREFKDFMWSISERTAQPGFNIRDMVKFKIPLPPKAEHDRIVAKLDAIMQEVESNTQRLEKIPKLLKRFRQSVLAAAVSGRLTEAWRRKNRISEEWEGKSLIDVIIDRPKNGYSAKPVSYETPFRVLTLTSTTSGKFIDTCFKYFDEEVKSDSNFWLQPNDILVQRGNTLEYVGVSAIYTGEAKKFIFPDLMMMFRANEKVLTKFLYYSLSSEQSRKYLRDRATGTAGNMPKINQPTLMSVPVLLPTIEEQKEIVRRVDQLLAVADKIETNYSKAKSMLDKLPQSILAKAFRGELVPQVPTDEPASVLLERIKSEKEKQTVKRKRRT